jgi:demethylmenaquinone methyltransferase/2-methoxy-6-polyprenyl-1,4-benzoquinol methylase
MMNHRDPIAGAEPRHVNFGREQVSRSEKTKRVEEVFHTVAERYDVMNDFMSLGLHRLMKRVALECTGLRAGQRALDLAGGTGDMSRLISPVVGKTGHVVLCDINQSMLTVGRDRVLDAGLSNIANTRADAELLPFSSMSFDCVIIAFGLRNLTDKERGLQEMFRVLRNGGRLIVLEFSTPKSTVLANTYGLFQRLWPIAGRMIVGDASPYQYLVESIKDHPDQTALALMVEDAGFESCQVDDLLGGIVAIHRGLK